MRNLTLLTDLYQLTMAQGYWACGKTNTQSCFTVFFRQNPFEGGYAISCGCDQIVQLVENFEFTEDDIRYLQELPAPDGTPLFNPEFLTWLAGLKLTVDIDVVPDGTVAFPREPLVRVKGPLLQCQLLETAILNGVNFQTLIATKAARVCQAAAGRPVAEFGLRRAQGPDGGMSASRAAYIGGCASVANVAAGQAYQIPVSGTHAHSWVMSFPTELEAFRAYAQAMPHNACFLVDTYDVEQGVQNAITVAKEMEARGQQLAGIRIDSGDLAWLSRQARQMLDAAGLPYVKITGSNDLDEHTIQSLIDQGAQFDSFGVGTRLSTGAGQDALGAVYKLAATREEGGEWQPRIKVSAQTIKLTIPGLLNTRRYFNEEGKMVGDVIFDVLHAHVEVAVAVNPTDVSHRKKFTGAKYEDLLQPLVRNGEVTNPQAANVHEARSRAAAQLAQLDPSTRRFLNPHWYPAGIERGLFNRRTQMVRQLRHLDSLY